MPYFITNRCLQCDICVPQCPTGAIQVQGNEYWIDPTQCNECEGYAPEPQCVLSCPVDSPVLLQAKRGRCKSTDRPTTSLDLFLNGKNSPFASAIVVWELCNILAQRQSLPWAMDIEHGFYYQRQVNRGRASLKFWVSDTVVGNDGPVLMEEPAQTAIASFDIRAACLHLVFAAHAAALEHPWREEFVVSDRQIEQYLGLDKRKDLNKLAKLTLIRELVEQPCRFLVDIDWVRRGQVEAFSTYRSRIWHLVETQHHFQEDEDGCKHLVGLTFRIQAGDWAAYFLNQEGYWSRTAFYQYGHLPQSLLLEVMSNWQQREGAARMMLWLLFKTRMGEEQRITVQTLMRVAYGEEKLAQAIAQRTSHKRLLHTFESDLELLHYYGLKPVFDPETYPPEIQPLWAKLGDLPDDAEAALEFWTNDGSQAQRLTDAAPRNKWKRIMNARILRFELPEDWETKPARSKTKKRRSTQRRTVTTAQIALSSTEIVTARKQLQLSQRALANQVGKSQSWIRDVENGRFQPNEKDQALLRRVLKLG
ncbi:MAG: 4Fe-4S binding protein [Synechococcales bacterium]|nr:4Fe-4S binding protein [Synechococcales bacterium]